MYRKVTYHTGTHVWPSWLRPINRTCLHCLRMYPTLARSVWPYTPPTTAWGAHWKHFWRSAAKQQEGTVEVKLGLNTENRDDASDHNRPIDSWFNHCVCGASSHPSEVKQGVATARKYFELRHSKTSFQSQVIQQLHRCLNSLAEAAWLPLAPHPDPLPRQWWPLASP